MRILLDECIPLPVRSHLADLPHTIVHATEAELCGVSNGAMYAHAVGRFELLVTSDRHFRSSMRYPVRPDLGIVFVRIVPNTTGLIAPALRNLLIGEPPAMLIGHRTALRRDGWEQLE